MRRFLLLTGLLLAMLGLAGEAPAIMKAGPGVVGGGLNVRLGGPGTAPPLDGFTQPAGAYSFRKLRSAYTGAAVRIRRTTGGETDIGFLGFTGFTGAPWDEAAAASFCAATTCFVTTWYDQSGNARNMTQATAANQPALIFSCNGTLPCQRMTANTQTLVSAAYTPPSALMSFSVVAKRAAGAAACYFLRTAGTGNRVNAAGAANTWSLSDGTQFTSPTAADGVWHAAQGVIQGAGSSLTIDGGAGPETPITGSTAAGALSNLGPASGSCDEGEAIYWPAYGLTAGEIAALTNNQRSFWGTP